MYKRQTWYTPVYSRERSIAITSRGSATTQMVEWSRVSSAQMGHLSLIHILSTGQFSTLNLGTSRGDSMENVLRNYEILGAAVGFSPEEVVHTWQEHTDIILRVGKSDCGKGLFCNQPDVCDGLITNEPGVALVCFAADCTPILFYDPVQRVVAAIHAGWRGTANGIARKAVEKMIAEFGSRPEDILSLIHIWKLRAAEDEVIRALFAKPL